MLTLPSEYHTLIQVFAPLFSKRVWCHIQVLVIGAILAPGERTTTAVLRIMGMSQEKHFQNYHRVLNRAVWCGLETCRLLLTLLITTFAAVGDLVIGLDDTIECRRGENIKAKGIYRDPVRSSHGHFVKASGLRWLSVMLLVPIPWAQRVWALPSLTALAPSARYYQRACTGAQNLDRLGSPTASAGAAVVPPTTARGRRGRWFCCDFFAFTATTLDQPDLHGDAFSFGCGLV